jgi:hypothetical protein
MKRRLGDRRGRPRFEIVGELWGTLETVIAMPLRNIGHGGALVQSVIALPSQSVHHVAVSCNGILTPASVRVQHVRPMVGTDGRDYFLIGLEFISMPTELAAQIECWMVGGGSAPIPAV